MRAIVRICLTAIILFSASSAALVAAQPLGSSIDLELKKFFPAAFQRAYEDPGKLHKHKYSIACVQRVRGRWLSFLEEENIGVVLFQYSAKKPQNAQDVLTQRPGENPYYFDWGYVYDRNADGRIDWITFYQGVGFMLYQKLPKEIFEQRNSPDVKINSPEMFEDFNKNIKMFFYFASDNNFDGKVDALVQPVWHEVQPLFIEAYGVLVDTYGNGIPDSTWIFTESIDRPIGEVPHDERGYRISMDSSKRIAGKDLFEPWDSMLTELNSIGEKCGISGRYARGPYSRSGE